MSEERICIICDNDFSVKYPSDKTKTCSKECRISLTRKSRLEGNKNAKTRICIICDNNFNVKYPSDKTKTCSKECKNILASQKTIEYNKKNPKIAEHKKKLLNPRDKNGKIIRSKKWYDSMKTRDFSGENHPSYGMVRSPEWRAKIGKGNKGKFKGQTWDEMYGVERATQRRKENAHYMAATNEKLLTEKTSKLENIIGETLIPLGYKQNRQVGKYTVDFIRNKEIIEVYGDFWHCNPEIYDENYFNKCINMLAIEKWAYDETRTEYLQNKGYTVTILWESDLIKNYL